MIKEYSEEIKKYNVPSPEGYRVEAGEYIHWDDVGFIIEVTDFSSGRIYTETFNSAWCPEDNKEWLCQVLAKYLVDTVDSVKRETKSCIREKYKNFIESME